jgi:hypothetical protein
LRAEVNVNCHPVAVRPRLTRMSRPELDSVGRLSLCVSLGAARYLHCRLSSELATPDLGVDQPDSTRLYRSRYRWAQRSSRTVRLTNSYQAHRSTSAFESARPAGVPRRILTCRAGLEVRLDLTGSRPSDAAVQENDRSSRRSWRAAGGFRQGPTPAFAVQLTFWAVTVALKFSRNVPR